MSLLKLSHAPSAGVFDAEEHSRCCVTASLVSWSWFQDQSLGFQAGNRQFLWEVFFFFFFPGRDTHVSVKWGCGHFQFLPVQVKR